MTTTPHGATKFESLQIGSGWRLLDRSSQHVPECPRCCGWNPCVLLVTVDIGTYSNHNGYPHARSERYLTLPQRGWLASILLQLADGRIDDAAEEMSIGMLECFG